MTWSGGAPGHINTFNSEGFENRNAAPYKKGDNYEVLEAYYDTLNANPETISQFNHRVTPSVISWTSRSMIR